MKELWDARDRDGNLLGVDLVRGEPVPEGMYHLVCDAVVRHVNGDFLLMLRDPEKPIHPGEWELTGGGSALKGEDGLACIRRELFEETGIRCEAFTEVFTVAREHSHILFRLYFAETDCDPSSVRLQMGETVDYRWVDRQALEAVMDGWNVISHMRRDFEACVERGLIR